MAEKDNIQDILSELKKVLKDLTAEKEGPPRDLPVKPVEGPTPAQPAAVQQVPATTPAPPPPPPPPVSPAPVAPSVVTAQPVSPPQPVSQTPPQPSPSAPVSPAPSPVIQPSPAPPRVAPQPGPPVSQVIVSAVSQNAIRFAIFCASDQVCEKDIFLKTLTDITKKTSKKPLEMEKIIDGEIDVFTANWEEISENAKSSNVNVIFLIHPETFDSVELKHKFETLNIFFGGVQASKVSKKITYVDLVIELMLAKK